MGVMLFSLGGLFWQRRLSLPRCLEQVAALGPDQGIELIGAQSLSSYPEVSADDVRSFRAAVDRTGVVPVSYCAYLERARSRSRVLAPVDAVPLLEQEIATARRLGFPMVRVNTATPEVLRALAPLSERTGMTLVVELATEPRTDPAVQALVEELDRLGCPGLGVIQDFSAFVRAVPAPFVEATVAEGTPPGAVAVVVDAWTAGRPLAEALDAVRALPGLDPTGLGLAVQAAHMTYALFRSGSPEGLRDVLPHLRHVQAKFFATAPDGSEPCVPYAELLPILRDGGYRGRLHSEFEGFLWSDDLDPLAEIARQQQYLARLWEEPA
jgi:sugar phosphate isomerase/epimerase